MSRALYTAATGMIAQQMNVDNIANNLANVNTTGYKKSKIEFQDLLYQQLRLAGATQAEGAQVPVELQIGYGTRPVATQRIFTQGTVISTNNPLDVSIDGDGFLQISLPDGTVGYTRDGALKKSADGTIVTSDGYSLEPSITVPQDATDLNISLNGEVSVRVPGDTAFQQAGQIELARFVNPAGLRSIGRNLFLETEASGTPLNGSPDSEGFGQLSQRFLAVVAEEQVHQAVEDFVIDQLEGKLKDGERVVVHARWQGEVLLDRPGDVVLKIRLISSQTLRGPSMVRVELLVDGATRKVLTVTADVRFFTTVMVTTRAVRRGTVFYDDDSVELVERDVTTARHGFFTGMTQLEGLRARRPIGYGAVISRRHVEEIPVIERGDDVEMTLTTSHMQISTVGVALQDGAVGSRIRVKNVDSGKIVYGEVLDAGTVRLGSGRANLGPGTAKLGGGEG